VAALSVTLIGAGLLLGGLVRTVSQLNTWSTFPLLLVIMPVFFVVLDLRHGSRQRSERHLEIRP